MEFITTIENVRNTVNSWRKEGYTIGFVPTMGNLHEGHLTLVRAAKKICDVVVVSIFVNPIQFGAGEDFDSYPRTLEQDSRLLADVDCDIIFAPSVEQMYGTQPRLTNISVGQITDDLCGKSRPGHFDGVAVVVTKLFNIVQPNFAFFGQKDYQQLAVIRQLVQDLNMPLEVIGVPIVRAEDGLALSSRNGYLSEQQRAIAPTIYQLLKQAEQQLHEGQALAQVLESISNQLTQAGFVVDYVEARQTNLQPIAQFDRNVVLFVAAKLGTTRLIDNLQVDFKT